MVHRSSVLYCSTSMKRDQARKTKEVGDGDAAASPSAAFVSVGCGSPSAAVSSAGGAAPSAAGVSAGGCSPSAAVVSAGGAALSAAEVSAGAVPLPAGASVGGAAAGGAPPAASSGGAGVNAAWSREIFPTIPPTGSPPSVLFSVAWEIFA